MDTVQLLKELCESHCPSSREDMLYSMIKNIFDPFGHIYMDSMNNIIIHKKGRGKDSVMIMAHIDEVFLIVTEICDGGFLKFKGVGIDPKSLVSQEVVIHGKEKILGIIGIKPSYIMTNDEKNKGVSIDNLLIDTGYSKESLEKIIKVGDFVTLKGEFVQLLNNNVSCKSIDNRAGITAMYECAKELHNFSSDLDIYFVCSCQEEVGHRGAKMVSYNLNPHIGIVIDTTFDSGPMGDKERENILGNGPIICVGPNLHPELNKKIMDVGRKYKIPYGVEVEPGNTGTDAWDIQITRSSIPTLLLSIPIKYMHTRVEVANLKDIKNTGKLIAKFIEELNGKDLEEILCF
jgi:tetrahedral aminopeptidase